MEGLTLYRKKKKYDIVSLMNGERGLPKSNKKFDKLQITIPKPKQEKEYQKVNKSY